MEASRCSLIIIAVMLSLSVMWSGCGAQHIASTIPAGTNVTNVGSGSTIPAGPNEGTPNYRKR